MAAARARRSGLGHTVKALSLAALISVAYLVGTSHASFVDGDQNPANQFQAGYWSIQHVGLVGTTSCAASTTDVVTVTHDVPVGHTLIVRLTSRDGNVSNPTTTDSKGNTYQRDAYVDSNSIDYAIFSARVTTALAAGDTITVTHGDRTRATFMRVDEFSGIADAGRVLVSATDSGNASSTSLVASVPAGDAIAIAGVGIKDDPAVTPPTGWMILNTELTSCNRSITSVASYRISAAAGSAIFDPTWSRRKQFSAAIVVYLGE